MSPALLAVPAPTIEANISVTGGAGSGITLSLPESFSFTLDTNFTGYGVYLVAHDAFSAPVTPPAYGYNTSGSGLRLETSTGAVSYSPSYTAGNSYFGTSALALEFSFSQQMNFVAGTVITITSGSVSTGGSPVAAGPNLAGPYSFAITDGNGNYFTPTAVATAVPEPATFSAIAGGLVLMGVALRRRRHA